MLKGGGQDGVHPNLASSVGARQRCNDLIPDTDANTRLSAVSQLALRDIAGNGQCCMSLSLFALMSMCYLSFPHPTWVRRHVMAHHR
jgi:hypothetical protein